MTARHSGGNQRGWAYREEYAHGAAALFEAVDIADHARTDGQTPACSERLDEPPYHDLGDRAGLRYPEGPQSEEGERREIYGPAAICART